MKDLWFLINDTHKELAQGPKTACPVLAASPSLAPHDTLYLYSLPLTAANIHNCFLMHSKHRLMFLWKPESRGLKTVRVKMMTEPGRARTEAGGRKDEIVKRQVALKHDPSLTGSGKRNKAK